VICDVRDERGVDRPRERRRGREHGQLDIAVNSAGVSGGDTLRPLAEYNTAPSNAKSAA